MMSVLVVDHSTTDRERLVSVLGFADYRVLEAATAEQALELARREQPDVIIADILMPAMDGYEFVRELGDESNTADIPVILHTATYVLEEAQQLAGAVGISRILLKPSEPEEVIRVVGEAISSARGPVAGLPSEEFHREHLRLLNAKLLQKVEELREALAGTLHQESDRRANDGASATRSSPAPQPADLLSPRELEVLVMLAEGATNAEIAKRLVIADTTVQSHVKRILRKLGVRNRTEAAARYLRF